MSVALSMTLIFMTAIIVWGLRTDWTFSGLLPNEGAKCTPDEDDEDENATRYVYDEDGECIFIEKCKAGWEPTTSNTICEFSKRDEVCTANTVYIANVKDYGYNDKGTCSIAKTCISGSKLSTDAKKCEYDENATCTANTVYIENVDTYKFSPSGVCNLAHKCKLELTPSKDAKSCIDEWALPIQGKLLKYQALGHPADTDKNEPEFTELTATTVEGCRIEAKKKGAQMVGFRATGDFSNPKSCWMYDEPDMDTSIYSIPKIPQGKYWVECTDPSKNAATSLCTKS